MYSTTHLAMGLIIGKLTGDYPAALLGSLIIDIDHLIPAAKEKRLFNIKEFWRRSKSFNDSARSFLHGLPAFIIISALICLFDWKFGLVFALAYLGHLILDALDDSSLPILYPNKKIDIKGFIPYYSREELLFSVVLFSAYLMV